VESKNLVKRVGSEIIHKGEYINLREDKLEKNGKIIAKRDVVEHVGSIVAVPYEVTDYNLYFYLVKQWRNPIEDWVLEFPAGTLNENEDHEIAVIRELQEEIGMKPNVIQYWSHLYVAPGWCNEKIHCYMAGKLEKSELESDIDEQISVIKLSYNQMLDKIKNHEIIDLKTISAFNIFDNYYKNDLPEFNKK
jgi:ADP-ribose pyrophosphatase